jgi:plastocyanin
MKIRRSYTIWFSLLVLPLLLMASYPAAEGPQGGGKKYVCSETNPETMCNAATTCGSASAPCTVDVKRSANAASVTPDIPNAKSNKPFCVKVGTTVTWKSSSKNTGFVLDFGPSSPFDQGTIIGGSDRAVSALAKKAGCYKFSAGACVSGSIYGMCGSVDTEVVVTSGGN